MVEIAIDAEALQAIPQPSTMQIEKDLKRESLVFNGESITGSQG